MTCLKKERFDLSPVQSAMLRNSLLHGASGRHIEQVVLEFNEPVEMDQVAAAWWATVKATVVLRTRFAFESGDPVALERCAEMGAYCDDLDDTIEFEAWLEADRQRGVRVDSEVPWRVNLWPNAKRMVWTFHHALLDGHSITRIVSCFLQRLEGREPGPLELLGWEAPDEDRIAEASAFHAAELRNVTTRMPDFPEDVKQAASFRASLGAQSAAGLEAAAERMNVTTTTLLIWAWGQALATAAAAEAVVVAKVRFGASEPTVAGFYMNTIPLVVHRARQGSVSGQVQALWNKLQALRKVESVPIYALPEHFPVTAGTAWPGGVVMVESGTIQQQAGHFKAVRSINIRESAGGGLLACAHVLPEIQLEVQTNGDILGPQAVEALLEHWKQIVSELVTGSSDESAMVTRLPDSVHQMEDGGKPVANESVPCLWGAAVRRFGDLPAVWTEHYMLSYAELDQRSSALAGALLQTGLQVGETVASLLQDRSLLACVMLAVAKAVRFMCP